MGYLKNNLFKLFKFITSKEAGAAVMCKKPKGETRRAMRRLSMAFNSLKNGNLIE